MAFGCSPPYDSTATTAQVYSGTLTGVVTDATGAVLPGAKAVLTDVDKGTFAAASDSEGRFVIRNLPPANYRLAVSATGMQNYAQQGITLAVGQTAQVNVQMQVQGSTETVSVQATAALLQTEDASTGQWSIKSYQRFAADKPKRFQPGATCSRCYASAGRIIRTECGATNFISNGGRNSTSDILMDGVSQTNQENNSGITTALYTPPVDACQEFNVQQNTYSADIGFGGNTVINVVTKSGTNAFHGSAYEFLQNSPERQ